MIQNLPVIIILLSLVLCLISYVDNGDFTLFWSWASNIVYVSPILVSYRNENNFLAYFFTLILILSTSYHICYAYDDACIIISHNNWVHVDVLFSWLLLYTLISYVVFKHRYRDILLLTNVVIVVMTMEAECDESNFDCQFTKIALAIVYFMYFLYEMWGGKYIEYAPTDSLLSAVFLLAASIFYFNGSYKPSHSLWHVLGATGASFALSIYKDAEYRIINFQKDEGERQPLIQKKRNDLYYRVRG